MNGRFDSTDERRGVGNDILLGLNLSEYSIYDTPMVNSKQPAMG
jgi:hypothetical protein